MADYNQATPCLLATIALCNAAPNGTYQARRPVPTFGDIEIAYGGGSSSYNSLQMKVEKRQGALYVLNSFTYSRTFDLSSGHLETSNGDNSRVNFANPRNDYGPSGYDQPLADTTSIVYDLPYGHGRRYGSHSGFLADTLLGGWQVTTVNTMTKWTATEPELQLFHNLQSSANWFSHWNDSEHNRCAIWNRPGHLPSAARHRNSAQAGAQCPGQDGCLPQLSSERRQ